MGFDIVSDCLYECVSLPNEEVLALEVLSNHDTFLQVDAWEFYKLILSEKDLIWSIMIQEEGQTVQSVSSRWQLFEELGLKLISQMIPGNKATTIKPIFRIENLTFDQVLINLFECFVEGGVIIHPNKLRSSRSNMFNIWGKDFSFLSNYFVENCSDFYSIQLFENRWNVLVDEHTDADGVVEMMIHYAVQKLSLFRVDQFVIVGTKDTAEKIQNGFQFSVLNLRTGKLNDWNTDFTDYQIPYVFSDGIDADLPILDWTNGKNAFPDFKMNSLI